MSEAKPDDQFVRHVRSWNSRKMTGVAMRPIKHAKGDSVLLRALVESETWPALVACVEDSMAKHRRPFSTEPKELIGGLVSSIVRDVTEEIFRSILERAALADERDVAPVE